MVRLIKKSGGKHGLPPGSIVHVGDNKTDKVKISILDYSYGKYNEIDVDKVEDCIAFKPKPSVTWINVDGVHDVEVIKKLGDCFDIHPLIGGYCSY